MSKSLFYGMGMAYLAVLLNVVWGRPVPFADFGVYLAASTGDYTALAPNVWYYPQWLLPLFWPFTLLPFWVAYSLFVLLSVGLYCYVVKTLDLPVYTLLTFPVLGGFLLGQVTALILAGLALIVYAIRHERYMLAGVGITLAVTKPQWAGVLAGVIWLSATCSWSDRGKMLLVPIGVFLASLMVYGLWPIATLHRMQHWPVLGIGSVTTAYTLGGPVLFLLALPALLSMELLDRLYLVHAALFLALPYVSPYDGVILAGFNPYTAMLSWFDPLAILLGIRWVMWGIPVMVYTTILWRYWQRIEHYQVVRV